MKNIALALIVMMVIGFTSCNKETDVTPVKKPEKAFSYGDKKNNTGWN